MLTSVREPSEEAESRGSLACSNHALEELMTLRNMSLAKSKVRALNCRSSGQAEWGLEQPGLAGGIPACGRGVGTR